MDLLAENGHTKKHRTDRHEQGHQQKIGRTGRGQNAKVERVSERRAEHRCRRDGGPCGDAGHRVRPRTIDDKREWQHHECSCRHLACCRHHRLQAAKPPPEYASAGIAKCRAEDGDLCHDIRRQTAERHRSDHHDNADNPQENAAEAVGRHPFILGPDMRQQYGEERRRGVQDCRETAGDLRLAPGDETKRDEVVQCSHASERSPGAKRGRHTRTACQNGNVQDDGAETEAQAHDGEWPHLSKGGLGQEEDAAPKKGESKEEAPFRRPHPVIGRCRRHPCLPIQGNDRDDNDVSRGSAASRFLSSHRGNARATDRSIDQSRSTKESGGP